MLSCHDAVEVSVNSRGMKIFSTLTTSICYIPSLQSLFLTGTIPEFWHNTTCFLPSFLLIWLDNGNCSMTDLELNVCKWAC